MQKLAAVTTAANMGNFIAGSRLKASFSAKRLELAEMVPRDAKDNQHECDHATPGRNATALKRPGAVSPNFLRLTTEVHYRYSGQSTTGWNPVAPLL